MNLMTVRSLLDELEKIAVSEEWIRRHARRGSLLRHSLSRDEHGARLEGDPFGSYYKTLKGKERPPFAGTKSTLKDDPRTRNKRQAKIDGTWEGFDDYSRGQRLKEVGGKEYSKQKPSNKSPPTQTNSSPTSTQKLPSFAKKHWKKGVAGLAATGLAAGAYALHKKRKSNREKTAESEEGGAVNYVKGIGKNLKGAAKDLTHPISRAHHELRRMGRDINSAITGKKGNRQLTPMQRAGKIGNHGLTAAFTVPAAAAALKKDPSGQTSRAERVSRFVGSTIGNLATSRRGLSGSIAGSIAGDQAGKLVGKGINKVTGFKPKKTEQEATK